MKDFDEYDDTMDLIHQSLDKLLDMGLVEVVGITPDGDWLYGATELGNKLANSPSFKEAIRQMGLDEIEEE